MAKNIQAGEKRIYRDKNGWVGPVDIVEVVAGTETVIFKFPDGPKHISWGARPYRFGRVVKEG